MRLALLVFCLVLGACGSDDRAPASSSMDSLASTSKKAWCGVETPTVLEWAPPIVVRRSAAIPSAHWKMIERSLATWEKAVGRSLFYVHEDLEPRSGEDFSGLEATIGDGINGNYYDARWSANTGKPSAVLATTVFRPGPTPEADVRYNLETYAFGDAVTAKNEGPRFIADLESVSLHELGHLLGLGHAGSDEPESVMQPSVDVGEGLTKRQLSSGDVARIQALFKGVLPALRDRTSRPAEL